MAHLGFSVSLDQLPQPETTSYELLPDGWYNCVVDEAETKETKAGTGMYIKLKIKVTGPTHANRILFTNVNIQNPNEVAQRIGLEQLRSIMQAGGLASVEDTDQLIGINVSAKVGTQPAQNGYEAQNQVKAFKPMSGGAPVQQTAQPTPAAPAASAPPWAR